MKKLLITIFVSIMLILSFTPNTQAQELFRFEHELSERRYVDGIEHIKRVGTMIYGEEITSQHYNYLGVNVKTTDYNIIASDNYRPYEWGMSNLAGHIEIAKARFPHLDFVGGVNGDFYDIENTGRASNTHIVNFEVIHRGPTGGRSAVGFTDEGDMVYGTPSFLGQHLNILNEYKELKMRLKIDRINQLPQNDLEIAIFHQNYASEIPADYHKVIVKASDLKSDASGNINYSKGVLDSKTTDAHTMEEKTFVLVGKAFQDDNLITSSDTVLVQELLGNGFENVRNAIGTGQLLVKDGAVQHAAFKSLPSNNMAHFRHPRTAIGQKADGTVFFIVVDGRDALSGKYGVKYSELGELMKMHGAVTAFNLDGGGSSTMLLRNSETGEYEGLNTYSDGHMRSISNGLLFARGDLEPVFVDIPYPDTRTPFEAPTGLFVDSEGVFHFTGNSEHMEYVLKINGREQYLTKETISLLLAPGQHEIQVRVKGNAEYSTSPFSESYTYNVHKNDVKIILDLIRNIAQGN
ncbi:phosphodiester glycosidase family protein [Acholeplasma laidlawii]|uniref:phosphodiester glycosidase family protein n=1 Tax=Acholeplasma laidlawii TaxID=2148 RepID=UPI0018C2223B|nr:phosphodiester glycosidase family protein [Acholeplasma laidlawii]MBG0762521.1 phosphodiester glycosidase family protein [Acholeplasma laidlawii]